jgi:hypothetical protein
MPVRKGIRQMRAERNANSPIEYGENPGSLFALRSSRLAATNSAKAATCRDKALAEALILAI